MTLRKRIIKISLLTTLSLSITFSTAFASPLDSNIPAPWDKINQNYEKLTPEQQKEVDVKSSLAEAYVKEKRSNKSNGVTPLSAGGSKINAVGTMRQSLSYTCGPASARNLINGYVWVNGGTVPTEAHLVTDLGTTSSGTAFSATPWQNTLNSHSPGNNYTLQWATSNWNTNLANKVMYTIDKSNNYDVIGDLYHGATSTPVNPVYSNGAAHYICVYGYNDSSHIYYIADSYTAAPVTYTTPYINLANSTQQRGIVW